MKLPIELVNYIMEFSGLPLHLVYNTKWKNYMFHFDEKHSKFSQLRRIYDTLQFHSVENRYEIRTNIYYSIPLRKAPSFTDLLPNIVDMSNYMNIVVIENEETGELLKDYHTSMVIETQQSALMLN